MKIKLSLTLIYDLDLEDIFIELSLFWESNDLDLKSLTDYNFYFIDYSRDIEPEISMQYHNGLCVSSLMILKIV